MQDVPALRAVGTAGEGMSERYGWKEWKRRVGFVEVGIDSRQSYSYLHASKRMECSFPTLASLSACV